MGYKRQTTTYKLQFTGTEYAGLEVEARSISAGRLLKLIRLAELATAGAERRGLTQDDMTAIDGLFTGFAGALIRWNLEDEDGTPVPTTVDGVKSQDFEFIMAVIGAWIEAVAGVPADLGKDSTSGVTFPEHLIPMDAR